MQFNTQLTINAEFLFEFTSKEDWANNAQRRFAKFEASTHEFQKTICTDTNGHVCHVGSDFMLAENLKTYPVKVYALQRVVFANNQFTSPKA